MKSGNRVTLRHPVQQQLQQIRDAVFRSHRTHNRHVDHMLRLALNEAEALAWQSGFPQLVFPTLAMEKAEAAVLWHERQRTVRQRANQISFAA